ncbi:MAG: hypothetical protein LAP85_21850 [Acidobacteriia bacterium]|nr:hypothetical protein [Terriglobia bacterium]
MSVVLSSVLLCLTMSVSSPQTASKPDPREKVETAIGAAIHLLELKDYKTFLLQFVPPDQVKARGGSPEALDAWIEYFSAQADSILAALKDARTQTPTYDAAKITATFPLKGEAGPKSLKMAKIGQFWYIGNK